MGPFLDKSRPVVATISSSVWLFYMHFAKLADFKFSQAKVLRLVDKYLG